MRVWCFTSLKVGLRSRRQVLVLFFMLRALTSRILRVGGEVWCVGVRVQCVGVRVWCVGVRVGVWGWGVVWG